MTDFTLALHQYVNALIGGVGPLVLVGVVLLLGLLFVYGIARR